MKMFFATMALSSMGVSATRAYYGNWKLIIRQSKRDDYEFMWNSERLNKSIKFGRKVQIYPHQGKNCTHVVDEEARNLAEYIPELSTREIRQDLEDLKDALATESIDGLSKSQCERFWLKIHYVERRLDNEDRSFFQFFQTVPDKIGWFGNIISSKKVSQWKINFKGQYLVEYTYRDGESRVRYMGNDRPLAADDKRSLRCEDFQVYDPHYNQWKIYNGRNLQNKHWMLLSDMKDGIDFLHQNMKRLTQEQRRIFGGTIRRMKEKILDIEDRHKDLGWY